MASQSASSDTVPEQMNINLQIVSPSVGVNRPLQFPATPASTTIKALKGLIRDALPLRPADSNQRLIYRGKALLREDATLLDILGAEAVRTTDQHTMHLVLRDFEIPPAPNPTPTISNNVPTGNQLPRPATRFPNHLGHGLGGAPTPAGAPEAAQPGQPQVQPRVPSPAPIGQQLPPPAAAAFQQQHQQLTSWLNQVQREAMSRVVNQNQRGRAQVGMRGIADPARDSSSRRGSPAPTHTIYRETHGPGPNGRTYQIESVIRNSATTGSQTAAYSVADIQNMVRNADSGRSSSATGASMRRTASAASLPPRSAPSLLNLASAPQQGSQTQPGLELYLLSSPEGPRAVLINNSTMETFYTPRNSTLAPLITTSRSQITVREWLSTPPDAPGYEDPFADFVGELHEPHRELPRRRVFDRANVPQDQAQAQAPPLAIPLEGRRNQPNVQPALQPLHGGNPMAGLGQVVLRLAPHIWNIARLGFFVWLFVGPNSSWTRWFVVISAAVVTFVVGTGALNGMSEHLWRPMMRHLENLFPTLDRPNQRQPVPAAQPGMEPNPAGMAARLVADHNGRQPWLSEQLRRIERAGLLFLASIAPGVAERHIANLEELARQEAVRRREAEAAATAVARDAERQATENGRNSHGAVVAESSRQGASDAALENNGEQVPARDPLVAL